MRVSVCVHVFNNEVMFPANYTEKDTLKCLFKINCNMKGKKINR